MMGCLECNFVLGIFASCSLNMGNIVLGEDILKFWMECIILRIKCQCYLTHAHLSYTKIPCTMCCDSMAVMFGNIVLFL